MTTSDKSTTAKASFLFLHLRHHDNIHTRHTRTRTRTHARLDDIDERNLSVDTLVIVT